MFCHRNTFNLNQNWDSCKLLKDDILKMHLQVDSVQLQKWRSSLVTHVSQSTSQHHLNWKDWLILLKIFFALSRITLQLQFFFTVAKWLVYPRPQQKPLQLFCPVANLQCVLCHPICKTVKMCCLMLTNKLYLLHLRNTVFRWCCCKISARSDSKPNLPS